jgi:hypothetical protein
MIVQQQAHARDDAAREAHRRDWLARVERELATAGTSAASDNPDALCRHLDQMVAVARAADVLSTADKHDIGARADAVKFRLRQRHLDAAAHPREHRTFTRWRAPPLTVTIGEHGYATVDWSLGGALLAGVEERGWKCGQTVDVEIALGDGPRYADKMIVVRYVPEQQRLALRSGRFAAALTRVKQDCDAAGATPA